MARCLTAAARLTAENRSLRDQLDRARDELVQLHQQRVSDWKQRQIDKEKLSRLNHTARKTRDKQAAGLAAREVKDAAAAANLHVTGSRCVHPSSLGAGAYVYASPLEVNAANLHVTGSGLRADAEGAPASDLDHEGHRSLSRSQRLHGTGRTLQGHVTTSETVETLPPQMLAATYPPRPRPLINTLQLPRIPHRTSST